MEKTLKKSGLNNMVIVTAERETSTAEKDYVKG
jgi:hypothetical protein